MFGSQEQANTAAAALGLKGSEFNSAFGLLEPDRWRRRQGAANAGGPGGLGGYNTSAQPGVTTGGVYTPSK